MNSLEKLKNKIVSKSIRDGLLTKEEYEKEYQSKYIDHYGFDSFINYLCILNTLCISELKSTCFLTLCEPILKDREKLSRRFGLKIKRPEEILRDDRNKD